MTETSHFKLKAVAFRKRRAIIIIRMQLIKYRCPELVFSLSQNTPNSQQFSTSLSFKSPLMRSFKKATVLFVSVATLFMILSLNLD